uniref:Cytochrome P450 n=1 Tax=Anopheles culicifacies TaxID=139723 RepID=A0A182MCH0_9DIPT
MELSITRTLVSAELKLLKDSQSIKLRIRHQLQLDLNQHHQPALQRKRLQNFIAMITLALAALALILLVAFLVKELWRPANYPPGPRWLPIVGNTPLVRQMAASNGGLLANVVDKLSETYQSSVVGLKLGQERMVVGLGYDDVKEIFYNEAFQSRPDNFFVRLRTLGTK